MTRTLVAGVDTSTQSCKVRVTDAETGEMVRFGQAKHPNGTSIDPKFWWDAFLEAAQQAGGLDDVEALAVGGQQHGMVILDQQGSAVHRPFRRFRHHLLRCRFQRIPPRSDRHGA